MDTREDDVVSLPPKISGDSYTASTQKRYCYKLNLAGATVAAAFIPPRLPSPLSLSATIYDSHADETFPVSYDDHDNDNDDDHDEDEDDFITPLQAAINTSKIFRGIRVDENNGTIVSQKPRYQNRKRSRTTTANVTAPTRGSSSSCSSEASAVTATKSRQVAKIDEACALVGTTLRTGKAPGSLSRPATIESIVVAFEYEFDDLHQLCRYAKVQRLWKLWSNPLPPTRPLLLPQLQHTASPLPQSQLRRRRRHHHHRAAKASSSRSVIRSFHNRSPDNTTVRYQTPAKLLPRIRSSIAPLPTSISVLSDTSYLRSIDGSDGDQTTIIRPFRLVRHQRIGNSSSSSEVEPTFRPHYGTGIEKPPASRTSTPPDATTTSSTTTAGPPGGLPRILTIADPEPTAAGDVPKAILSDKASNISRNNSNNSGCFFSPIPTLLRQRERSSDSIGGTASFTSIACH